MSAQRKSSLRRLTSVEKCEENESLIQRVDGSGSLSSSQSKPSMKILGSGRRKLIVLILCFVYFASCASFSILSPFFPREASLKGANGTIVGLIFGIYSLTTFICSPLMGQWLPKVGLRFMITSGLLLCGGAETMFGFVDSIPSGPLFIVFCMILRVVAAVGGSMADVAIFAIVAGEFPDSIGSVTGLMEVFSGLGFMAGPPLGGVLYSTGGFKLPFLVMGGSILATLPLVMFVLPMSEEKSNPNRKGSVFKLLKIPGISMLGSCIILSGVVLGFLDPVLSPHLEEFHLNPTQIGFMFLLMGAVYALSSPIVGWLGDKTKKTRVLVVIGVALADLGYLALGPSPLLPFLPKNAVWLAAVALILLGLSCSFYLVPCLPDMMETAKFHGLPDDITTHGALSGIFGSLISVGAFLGPTLGGAMNNYLKLPWSATVLSGILTFQGILLAIFSFFEAAKRRRTKQNLPITSSTSYGAIDSEPNNTKSLDNGVTNTRALDNGVTNTRALDNQADNIKV